MAHSLRPLDVFPITTRMLEVIRVADVTPGMRRITIGGPQLAAHTADNGFAVAAFRSDGFDDEFKILLKHPDAPVAVGPAQADGVLNWPRDNPHLVLRTYTVRRWDPETGEIDVDFVKHGVGPATLWAYSVQPGEQVQIAGPKMSAPHPEGADWTLVAGDETALPAIGRWLEEWPTGARGQVFIEVAEKEHFQEDLPIPEGVQVTWLSRDGAEAGTTTLLFDAIKAADWWEGTVFAWVAGETLTLTPIRRWLRNEKSLAKEQVEVTGYWRRQEVVIDEKTGQLDIEASERAAEKFHELTEIVPGFALRVAATIGIAAAFDDRERSVEELAQATGSDHVGLAKLLRYLSALGVTERHDDGRYALTDTGRALENDDVQDALSLDGRHAQQEIGGMLALLSAVRTGKGDEERWFGTPYAQRVAENPGLLQQKIDDDNDNAAYVVGALAQSEPFAGVSSIALAGRGTGALAEALLKSSAEIAVTVVAAPSEIAVSQIAYPPQERLSYEPGALLSGIPVSTEAVFLADVLGALPDADAEHVLRRAAASVQRGGRVLLFSDVLDPELADEHDYEHDLIDFAVSGGGARTHEEHVALFTAAGLPEPLRTTIGWGYTLYSVKV